MKILTRFVVETVKNLWICEYIDILIPPVIPPNVYHLAMIVILCRFNKNEIYDEFQWIEINTTAGCFNKLLFPMQRLKTLLSLQQ